MTVAVMAMVHPIPLVPFGMHTEVKTIGLVPEVSQLKVAQLPPVVLGDLKL